MDSADPGLEPPKLPSKMNLFMNVMAIPPIKWKRETRCDDLLLLALENLRQEDCSKFKISLGYIVHLR